jgi:hypothetical protein
MGGCGWLRLRSGQSTSLRFAISLPSVEPAEKLMIRIWTSLQQYPVPV